MRVPNLPESRVRELLKAGGVTDPVSVLAVRGYYRDTMGQRSRNDVGIHDDAWFAVGPGLFRPLQANTDPSKLGWNAAIDRNFAMLLPGLHYFIVGPHKGRTPAFRQATEEQAARAGIPARGHFPVWRAKNMDDVLANRAPVQVGYYAINIHDTGSNDEARTSSWGCQTAQRTAFVPWANAVQAAMRAAGQKRLPYLLINGPVS